MDKCDYHNCRNLAFMEVYWYSKKDNKTYWSYLCFPHWIIEQFIRKREMGYCLAFEYKLNKLWNLYCRISDKIVKYISEDI